MAAPNSTNVSTMKPLATGGVLVAPYGTTLPSKATPTGAVTLDQAFTAIGYMDQDSNVTNHEETSANDLYAWGGDLVLNVASTRKETYAFRAIEQNVQAWKLRYGSANVSGTDANALIKHNGGAYDEYHSIAIAEKLTDGRIHLTVIPKAKLEEAGDIAHSDSAAYGYEMTFTAIVDGDGDSSYELYYTA